MKNKEFNKQCGVGKLSEELKSAGFDIHGCSNAGDRTTIHLKDTETKDPTDIVEKHIYIAPPTPEQLQAKDKSDWQSAIDSLDKDLKDKLMPMIKIIEQKLNLK